MMVSMSLEYKIYRGDYAGGPVDYTTPVATVSTLSYSPAPIPLGSTVRYAVRAYDTVTGLEDQNTDATILIRTDAAGLDITGRPNAPSRLSAIATANGTARASWLYSTAGQGGAPVSFRVWLTVGASVNYAASPAATVAYSPDLHAYEATLTGLSHGTDYAIGVRATNAAGDETNVDSVSVTGLASGPDAPTGLTITATDQG
jgi:hypothetical protein